MKWKEHKLRIDDRFSLCFSIHSAPIDRGLGGKSSKERRLVPSLCEGESPAMDVVLENKLLLW